MKRIERHVLTHEQVEIIRRCVDSVLECEPEVRNDAAEDLLEVLNPRIHSGKRTVIVEYVVDEHVEEEERR